MFTNNYINFKKAQFEGTSYTVEDANGSSFGVNPCIRADLYDLGYWMTVGRCTEVVLYKQYSGTSSSFNACSYFSNGNTLKPGVYFGQGNTPATKADVRLELPITSGLGITNAGKTVVKKSEHSYVYAATFVLTNNTDAEMNIWEIGMFGQAARATSSNYSHYGATVLFDRVVLDAPVTIVPGGSKLVTYEVTFNQQLMMEEE